MRLLVTIVVLLNFSLVRSAEVDIGGVQGPMLIKTYFSDKPTLNKILALNPDIVGVIPGEFFEVVAYPEDLARLDAAGIQTEVIIPDMTAYYQLRNGTLLTMGGFHTLAETIAAMDSIHNEHPAITTARIQIGTAVQGRPIYAMKISDNPDVDENEPEVLFNALTHAREPIGIEVLLYTMRYLTDNYGFDPAVTELVDNRELWFIPIVNPDGYEYNRQIAPQGGGMWRKNRRNNGDGTFGVDLNRNYGYQWGYNDIGSSPVTNSEVYRGTSPFSEPETQAIRDFCNNRQFVLCLNYHSYSELFLSPWGYTPDPPEDSRLLLTIGDSATQYNGYVNEPGWMLYFTNGDADDWQYGERTTKRKTLSYTPEVGQSFWPNPLQIPALVDANLFPNLFVARIADNPWRLLIPQPVNIALGGVEVDTSGYNISWTDLDTLNPGVAYAVRELQDLRIITDSGENDLANWSSAGFALSAVRFHSGLASFYSGDLDSKMATLTASQPYYVQSAADTLTFWTWYDTEVDYDYGYVEVSTDQGQTFVPIPGNITTNDNPNYMNRGNGINGFSGGWVLAKFPLGGYAGQQIRIRFSYITDPFFHGEGWYIDEVKPVTRFLSMNTLDTNSLVTTYAIAHRTPGIYYYQIRARDAENQWGDYGAYDSLVVTGHPRFVKGDVNQDGIVDIVDAVSLIQYVFFANVTLPDPGLADLNDDGAIDLLDIIMLINMVF